MSNPLQGGGGGYVLRYDVGAFSGPRLTTLVEAPLPLQGARLTTALSGTYPQDSAQRAVQLSPQVTISGTISVTTASDTASATGAVGVAGTVAVTTASDTCSASGTVGGGAVTGTIAVTTKADVGAAYGPFPTTAFLVLVQSPNDAQWQVVGEYLGDEDPGAAAAAATAAFEAAYGGYTSGQRQYKLVRIDTLAYEVRPI